MGQRASSEREQGYVAVLNRFFQPSDESPPPSPADQQLRVVTLDELIRAKQDYGRVASAAEPFDRIVRGYEVENGHILDSYFSKAIPSGAVLTDRDEIHIKYPAASVASLTPEFEHSIWSCMSLSREANEVLEGKHCRTVQKVLFSAMVYLLTVLESQSSHKTSTVHVANGANGVLLRKEAGTNRTPEERIKAALSTVNRELARARNNIDRFATREAGKYYIKGMVLALVPLVAVALIFGNVHMQDWDEQALGVALVAGALGAFVSVMARTMKANQLNVDYHAGPWFITAAGFFRPMVGAVFGLVFYALVGSALLPIALNLSPPSVLDTAKGATDTAKEQMLLIFGVIAFFAGFSERFAQDTLVRTAGGLLGQGGNRSDKSQLVSAKPDPTNPSTTSAAGEGNSAGEGNTASV